ncbi:MAG: toprim domain-containing protein, partial [Pseudobdellovibrionaceae bacterium]
LTARHIRSEDFAIIVEGYMDLFGLYQAGIQNVAATLGTALTPDHGKVLKRLTQNIVVLFDGDEAGQLAAEKSLPILLNAGLMPKALTLPDGMDPDEFVAANGAEALRNLIKESPDLFSVILKKWMVDYRGEASHKVKICDMLSPIFASMHDPRLQSLYLHEAAERMRVDAQWLKRALSQSGNQSSHSANSPSFSSGNSQHFPTQSRLLPNAIKKVEETQSVKESAGAIPESEIINLKGMSRAEWLLLGLTLKSHSLWLSVKSIGILDSVLHPGVKLVFEQIDSYAGQGPEKFDKLASLLVQRVNHPEAIVSALEEISKAESEGEIKLLTDITRRLRERYLDAQINRLKEEMKLDQNLEKLEQFVNMQKEKLQLAKTKQNLRDLEE